MITRSDDRFQVNKIIEETVLSIFGFYSLLRFLSDQRKIAAFWKMARTKDNWVYLSITTIYQNQIVFVTLGSVEKPGDQLFAFRAYANFQMYRWCLPGVGFHLLSLFNFKLSENFKCEV